MAKNESLKLTPDQKRAKIAEACGWNLGLNGWWMHSTRNACKSRDLPDYLNDLNAMHEAEKVVMARGLWYKYCDALHSFGDGTDTTAFMHATAAQRSDAFLVTVDVPMGQNKN